MRFRNVVKCLLLEGTVIRNGHGVGLFIVAGEG